jgi:putative membrane protein
MSEKRSEGETQAAASGGKGQAATIVAALVGLIVATAVIGYFNVGAVLKAMAPIGVGGFLAVIAAQVGLFVPLGVAWWLVAPGAPIGRAAAFAWARLLREAASDVLPFSQLGGIAIAARAVVLNGVDASTAFGSITVDIAVEMVAQLTYTLIGVALLAHHLGFTAFNKSLAPAVLGGTVVALAVVVGFIVMQRRGLDLMAGLIERLAPSVGRHADAVIVSIKAAHARPGRMAIGLALHLFCWFGAAGGTWLILAFINHPLPYLSVVAIESLLFAIRNAAFIAPSGLGVQEGAYVLLGPLFGLPAEAALALSLLKRARDIAIGVPMLLSWQLLENRRVLRQT